MRRSMQILSRRSHVSALQPQSTSGLNVHSWGSLWEAFGSFADAAIMNGYSGSVAVATARMFFEEDPTRPRFGSLLARAGTRIRKGTVTPASAIESCLRGRATSADIQRTAAADFARATRAGGPSGRLQSTSGDSGGGPPLPPSSRGHPRRFDDADDDDEPPYVPPQQLTGLSSSISGERLRPDSTQAGRAGGPSEVPHSAPGAHGARPPAASMPRGHQRRFDDDDDDLPHALPQQSSGLPHSTNRERVRPDSAFSAGYRAAMDAEASTRPASAPPMLYSEFLPEDCIGATFEWASAKLGPGISLANVRTAAPWHKNLLRAPSVKAALKECPQACTRGEFVRMLSIPKGDYKRFGMVRGKFQDALAVLYIWHRCRQVPDLAAVDNCISQLVSAAKEVEALDDESIRLEDLEGRGHAGLTQALYLLDEVFLQANKFVVGREFEELAAADGEGALPLLRRIQSTGIALAMHTTAPGLFEQAILQKWASILSNLHEKDQGSPVVENLVNLFANRIDQFTTIASLTTELQRDTRKNAPLLKGTDRKRGHGHVNFSSATEKAQINELIDARIGQLRISEAAAAEVAAAGGGADSQQEGQVGGNESLGISSAQARAAFAKFDERTILGPLRVAAIAATGRVKGFKGCHPTFRNPSRADGKWGWACAQCAADVPHDLAGRDLEDVDLKDARGQRVNASQLEKHQRKVHDEAYCSRRWWLIRNHCKANPSDLWMCVPLDSAAYACGREEQHPGLMSPLRPRRGRRSRATAAKSPLPVPPPLGTMPCPVLLVLPASPAARPALSPPPRVQGLG